MKKALIAGLVTIVASAAVTACGNGGGSSGTGTANSSAGDSALVKAAKKEGSLTWYSGENPAFTDRVSKAFEKRYGIKVNWTRAVAADIQQRFSTEQKAGTPSADVMNTGTQAFFTDGAKSGWFVPISKLALPNVKSWPKTYVHEASAVISITPFVLGYNSDIVKADQVPQNWTDLLSSQNRNRLMMLDPRAAAAYLSEVQMWDNELGDGFVKNLGAAKPTLIQSSVPAAQALAAGEKAFLFPTLGDFMDDLIQKGAPIKLKTLDPTTGVEQNLAVAAHASHPKAARLFMNWVLSKDGQAVAIDKYKASPADVRAATNLPKNYVSPGDATSTPEQTSQILAMLKLH